MPNGIEVFMVGVKGFAVCFSFASHTNRSATQRYAFGTRLPLLAKNSPPDCFLNAQTLSGSNSLYQKKNKPKPEGFDLFLVGVKGFEPPTSCSQSRRAPNCATPRLIYCVDMNNQPLHYIGLRVFCQ